MSCPFCDLGDRVQLLSTALVIAIPDAHPVSPGHVLVIPRRHMKSYFDATHEERAAIWSVVEMTRLVRRSSHRPNGFNVGFNDGITAGQTVMHAHVHVIPRYDGDVADPRGGVRHALKGNS